MRIGEMVTIRPPAVAPRDEWTGLKRYVVEICAGPEGVRDIGLARHPDDSAEIYFVERRIEPAAAPALPAEIEIRDFAPLFVMVQPVYTLESRYGYQVTFHAFTPDGIRSRTAHTVSSKGSGLRWDWMRVYETGEPQSWSWPYNFDGETLEQVKTWHEREHGWKIIKHKTVTL